MVMQAQDTFVAVLGDGTERFVAKGEVLPDGHELVKRDQAGSGTLFRKLDLGEEEQPKPKPRAQARAAGKAAS
jgi:hypothetical protein